MLKLDLSTQFKKDLKKINKQVRDKSKLDRVVRILEELEKENRALRSRLDSSHGLNFQQHGRKRARLFACFNFACA